MPASFGQQRLWFLHQYAPDSPVYHIPIAFRLVGPLDLAALEHSVNAMVQRHESLRTTFVLRDNEVVQTVSPAAPCRISVFDLSREPVAGRAAALDQRLTAEIRHPFDLAGGPVFRLALFRLAPQEHVLLTVFHHIISDGWSVGVFTRELGSLYDARRRGAEPCLPELPIQYADFSAWQRQQLQGEALEAQAAFWRDALRGAPPFLDLPADRPRPPTETFRGAVRSLKLDRALHEALVALARDRNVTLFVLLLAAFNVLLHRYSGQEDITVGTPVADRAREETEGLIGFFVNLLALRANLAGNPPFAELLARLHATALGAWAHQEFPIEKLVELLQVPRDASRAPVFRVVLALQNCDWRTLALEGITVTPMRVDTGASVFDLTLFVYPEADGLECRVEFSTDLFDAGRIDRLLGHWRNLLRGIVANPSARLSELPLLSEAERRQVLVEWNPTATPYPRDRCIHELFEEQARKCPAAVALLAGQQHTTYGELDRQADRLAGHLRSLGVGPEVLVGVSLERSPERVAALLGILKAGGAYWPLESDWPDARIIALLADARPRVMLVSRQNVRRFTSLAAQCVNAGGSTGDPPVASGDPPDGTRSHVEREGTIPLQPEVISIPPGRSPDGAGGSPAPPLPNPRAPSALRPAAVLAIEDLLEHPPPPEPPSVSNRPGPDSLAYVMFTSGSTGTPKGVMVPHRAVVRLVKATNYVSLSPDETLLHLAPLSFDASTFEIWGALLNGARLAILPPHRPSMEDIGAAIRWHHVTTLWLTAPLFHLMVDQRLEDLEPLRQLLAGGDVLSVPRVRRFLEAMPACQLINGYGPTENTTFTCCHAITGASVLGASIPIGRPIANTWVCVLDAQLQPVPVGVPGELCAGGDGLARGYLGETGRDASAFLPNPFKELPGGRLYRTGDLARWRPDGTLEFLGRKDRQVKIRGFRVEPAEIEATLGQHAAVAETAVLAGADAAGHKSLCAHVVLRRGQTASPRELREFLRQRLPEHLVPGAILLAETLPLTTSGKVDREALAQRQPAAAADDFPERTGTELEQALVAIWEKHLGVRPVGVRDNFFALGGNSLLALGVFNDIAKQTGAAQPLSLLFQAPTIEKLAPLLRPPDHAAPAGLLVAIQPHGSLPPLFCVPGAAVDPLGLRDLGRHLGADQPLYGLAAQGFDGRQAPLDDLAAMAASYVREIRAVQRRGPYQLGGLSFGGVVAWEMACQLCDAGETVALLALFDTYGPGLNKGLPDETGRPVMARAGELAYRLMQKVKLHTWMVANLPPGQGWRYLRDKTRRRLRLILDLEEPPGPLQQNALRVFEASVQALRGYTPRPYPGRMTLFRGTLHLSRRASRDRALGWSGLALGGVEVHEVPAFHLQMVAEPFAALVAPVLRGCLARTPD